VVIAGSHVLLTIVLPLITVLQTAPHLLFAAHTGDHCGGVGQLGFGGLLQRLIPFLTQQSFLVLTLIVPSLSVHFPAHGSAGHTAGGVSVTHTTDLLSGHKVGHGFPVQSFAVPNGIHVVVLPSPPLFAVPFAAHAARPMFSSGGPGSGPRPKSFMRQHTPHFSPSIPQLSVNVCVITAPQDPPSHFAPSAPQHSDFVLHVV